MRAAGPWRRYSAQAPLLDLLRELEKHPRVRYLQVERGGDSVAVRAGGRA